jgi:hypothetical protein
MRNTLLVLVLVLTFVSLNAQSMLELRIQGDQIPAKPGAPGRPEIVTGNVVATGNGVKVRADMASFRLAPASLS